MDEQAGDFQGFFQRATGQVPYPFQQRLAENDLPEVLRAPTGAGKTAAAVLPWLFRRTVGPSAAIRAATPNRLAMALPMRSLVEQTVTEVRTWVAALRLDVMVAHLLGGDRRTDGTWRLTPDQPAVLVGTIDMLLSRALNRGYAMGAGSWPIDFGLVSNDIQWVFDEVQLMGPALPTSRQLQAFREQIGTFGPTRSMWMSATLAIDDLATVDAPAPPAAAIAALTQEDERHPTLERRLMARRTITRCDDQEDLADAALRRHTPGTRTIVVLNTVSRAQQVYGKLVASGTVAQVVLVHSRFRPPDRTAAMQQVLAPPGEEGTIVVTTQALEAGVDISASTLLTEVAPWSSVVQRAGRCNRYGEVEDAHLLWKRPEDSPPYDLADLEAAEAALRDLEGSALTGTELAGHDVAARPVEYLVLRRKDLLELSDTAPDLSGNTIDVGRFIRDSQDIDVRVAWRELMDGATPPSKLDDDTSAPTRDEICSAPIAAVRKLVTRPRGAPLWRFADQTGRWERCLRAGDVTPGATLLADLSLGRYDDQLGWADAINKRVTPVGEVLDDPLTAVDAGPDEGGLSGIGVWVPLTDHLRHTESHALAMVERLTDRIGPAHGVAVVRAAALHDIGKIHPVFQDTMLRSAADSERSFADSGGPWAKSSKRRIARHSRSSFSHALAGALALGDDAAGVVLEGIADVDLVRYLVAAHHGRVRLGIRSGTEDRRCPDGGSMTLGICHGEVLPEVRTPVGTLPETVLDLGSSHLGGVGSWTAMALAVRDREGMGPFRLAYLEALVRLADFRASAEEEVRA